MVATPTTSQDMKVTMLLKYFTIDKEKVGMKLDMIKQKLKQIVQTYYD